MHPNVGVLYAGFGIQTSHVSPYIPPESTTRTYSQSPAIMDDPLFCTWCGKGPFVRMETHQNRCAATKQKAAEASEVLQDLKRRGLLTAVGPAWKRQRSDFVEVSHWVFS